MTFLLGLLILSAAACGPKEPSFTAKPNILLQSFFRGDDLVDYHTRVYETLSVSNNENYVLATVGSDLIGKTNLILFVQNEERGFDQHILEGMSDRRGIGDIDLGVSNDGAIEIPLRVGEDFRLYRYSKATGLNFYSVPGDWSGGVVDNGVVALLSKRHEISYTTSKAIVAGGPLDLRRAHVGLGSELHDLRSYGQQLDLLAQGDNRSEFWYYVIDSASGNVVSKLLIEDVDYLADLRILPGASHDDVVIAESRQAVAWKNVSLGFVSLNLLTNEVSYDAYSSRTDEEITQGMACQYTGSATPFAVYAKSRDAGDLLFIDVGQNRGLRIDLAGKNYIKNLEMLDGQGTQGNDGSILLAYDAIRDYTAIHTLAIMPVSDFIECEK